jgi:hypothetical protein
MGCLIRIFDIQAYIADTLNKLKPEQFALLCYALDCIQSKKTLDLAQYPGVAQITMPNILEELLEDLKSESFYIKYRAQLQLHAEQERLAAAILEIHKRQVQQPAQTLLQQAQTTWNNLSTPTRVGIAATATAATVWSAYKIWQRMYKK